MGEPAAPQAFRSSQARRIAPSAVENGKGRHDARVWRFAERVATIGIFQILAVAALIYARPVAVPVVAAILVGTMVGLLVEKLAARNVPPFLCAFLFVGLVVGATYGLIVLFSAPFSSWIGRAPEIGGIFQERFRPLLQPLSMLQNLQEALGSALGGKPGAIAVDVNRTSILESLFTVATPALGQFFLFLGTLLFFVAGRAQLKRRLVVSFLTRDARLTMLRILRDIESHLARYLSAVTLVNAGLGVVTAIVLWAIGVPNAAMWGLLAFVLNYLPFIGPLLMSIILLAAGVITYDTLGWSLMPPVVFLVVHGIESQFVTPSVVGRSFTLNPFVVFISLAFWTWVWGPAGAFMAIPLLVVGLAVNEHLFPRDEVELPG